MSDLGGFSMHELFRAEVETHCAALTDGLLALERSPDDVSVIAPLMRAAHSIKGAARIVGVDAAVTVAHHMEDTFVRIQKGQERTTRARVDQLLEGNDFLLRIAALPEAEVASWSVEHAAEANEITTALSAPAPDDAPPAAPAPAPAAAPSRPCSNAWSIPAG